MRHIDHPDHDLDPRAFKMEGQSMRLYGKSDPPPAPDYTAAANATAEGNLDAAKYATNANRVNQYTPYGSLQYNYTPQYDSSGKETGAGWSQSMNLTPEAQNALNQQLALNQKYGDVANIGFDKARNIFENPQLNTSGLPQLQGMDLSKLNQVRGFDMYGAPQAPINAGQTAQQAIMSRLAPQLQQQDEALRTRLANQGISLGSQAYGREMNLQDQRANDLQTQAALQGIGLDQAARQQYMQERQAMTSADMAQRNQGLQEQQMLYGQTADQRGRMLQEQAYLQDRPLNLINALRTGNQVQSPQFQQFAQQATTSGPDLLGAANSQYQAGVNASNAQNAQTSGMLGGLMGVGMGIAGLPTAGGGSLGGNLIKGLF